MALRERFEIEQTIKVASADRQGKTDHLAVVDRKILEVQASKAADVSDYNQKLKDLRAEQKALLDTIENGVAKVKVVVGERLNDQTGQVETYRLDTGMVIPELTRALSREERQLDITDLDPKGTGKPGATKATAKAGKPPAKTKGKGGRGKSAGASAE
jgi:hypothetical protein